MVQARSADKSTPAASKSASRYVGMIISIILAGMTNVQSLPCQAQASQADPASDPAAALGRAEPEAATGRTTKTLATSRRQMIAAAHPSAVDAGLKILAAGGSAIDAAIAVQMVLGVVEPQSSGIGGGGFLLHWDAGTREVTSYDGRETAPAAATPDMFIRDGKPMPYREAVASGLSIGVPGLVAMLHQAHAVHGKLAWKELFDPAIKLADDGFQVAPRLARLLATEKPEHFCPPARAYFFPPNDVRLRAGDTLKNPALADTLRTIADDPSAFYNGPIAGLIADAARAAPYAAGRITPADMESYRPKPRRPVCLDYRRYRICGMGPPSSGGLTIAMVLTLLEPFDLGRTPLTARAVHLIAEAQKLAWADRNRYMADPDHYPIPTGLTDRHYLDQRRRLIDQERAIPKALPGQPPGRADTNPGDDNAPGRAGTTHISIVDSRGNAVALTSSIEGAFGSRNMAAGFLLNNQLTDFSFRPRDRSGRPIANAVAPGKRPRSSMSPTLVFGADGELHAVLGSPGGSRIILYAIASVIGIIDWRLDAQAVADLPNFGSRNRGLELEKDLVPGELPLLMRQLGHKVYRPSMTSGSHIVVRRPDGTLEGGADPRRDGVARGQ